MIQIEEQWKEVRQVNPLVHHITNYVTVNDCANVTLAVGASPVMADDREEAADMTSIASALVLNIGTLNSRTVESMLISGKTANQKDIPVIFDPVGAGASAFRSRTAETLLKNIRMTVIRGNISEIRSISGEAGHTRGVDASSADAESDARLLAEKTARQFHCVVSVTGAVDTVSDGERTVSVENGHPAMSGMTGTGCMGTSLTACFCGADPAHPLEAAVSALVCLGEAGEIAWEKAGMLGIGSYHMALLDAVSRMDGETLRKRARIHED